MSALEIILIAGVSKGRCEAMAMRSQDAKTGDKSYRRDFASTGDDCRWDVRWLRISVDGSELVKSWILSSITIELE